MQHRAVTTLGRGAVEAAAVVWPAKELARGQFAGQAAYVGVGGFFQPQKCFWKCGKVVRKHFLPKSFDCNWNLNKNRNTPQRVRHIYMDI